MADDDYFDDYESIYYGDDYFDEDYIECHICSCVIGDEVGYGYEMAPGEHVCDVCAGELNGK